MEKCQESRASKNKKENKDIGEKKRSKNDIMIRKHSS